MIGHTRYGNGREHVMVLSGMPGDHSNYDGMISSIDGEQFSYVFAEYRGLGRSKAMQGNYTLAEIAGDIEQLARSLDWDRFHLVGHSFGGFIAQYLAQELKPQVKSVVAVAPVPASGMPVDEAVKEFFLRALDDDEAYLSFVLGYSGNHMTAAWARSFVRYTRAIADPAALRAYIELVCRTDFAAVMTGLETPFLALLGGEDKLYNPQLMKSTLGKWLADFSVELLPGVGHFPMLEAPTTFALILERFFTRHSAHNPGRSR